MKPDISVIIVTWNSRRRIPASVGSVLGLEGVTKEVIIVDNGSRDGTGQWVAELHPEVRLLENRENRGFSAANNQGIAQAAGEFIILLNDDARLDPFFAARLVKKLRSEPRIGSATGKVLRSPPASSAPNEGLPRYIDTTGIELNRSRLCPLDRGSGQLDSSAHDIPGEIFGPSAAAAFYRRDALDEVAIDGEYLDEDFFAYYEDVDLAWRLKRHGWRSVYEPRALAFHERKGPEVKSWEIEARAFGNRYLLLLKNESLLSFLSYAPVLLPWETARVIRRLGKQGLPLAGLFHALRHGPAILRKRLREGRGPGCSIDEADRALRRSGKGEDS